MDILGTSKYLQILYDPCFKEHKNQRGQQLRVSLYSGIMDSEYPGVGSVGSRVGSNSEISRATAAINIVKPLHVDCHSPLARTVAIPCTVYKGR